jgi:hypothetical protein
MRGRSWAHIWCLHFNVFEFVLLWWNKLPPPIHIKSKLSEEFVAASHHLWRILCPAAQGIGNFISCGFWGSKIWIAIATRSKVYIVGLNYVVTLLTWTLYLFKWYMARFVVKNEHQNDMCYDEIGPRVRNWEGLCDQMCLNLTKQQSGHMYLCHMWLGMNMRADTENSFV